MIAISIFHTHFDLFSKTTREQNMLRASTPANFLSRPSPERVCACDKWRYLFWCPLSLIPSIQYILGLVDIIRVARFINLALFAPPKGMWQSFSTAQ